MVKKRSVKSFLTAMSGALVNIVLNFILIPSSLNLGSFTLKCAGLGVQGAAIATLISYVTVFIIRALDTRKLLKFNMHIFRFVINAVLILIGAFVMLGIENTLLLVCAEAACLAVMLVINIKPIVNMIKNMFSSKNI